MRIYKPAEDSFLLQKAVRKYASGKVLEIGTGTGIQAITAKKLKKVKTVDAIDKNKKAIALAKKNAGKSKIRFYYSDLFSKVKGTYDTIIFNPPYLPKDKYCDDMDLIGGKHGYEILARFLDNANKHLTTNGKILIVFSSLTKKQKVDEAIERNCLTFKEIDTQKLFMEKLYVYMIEKSKFLKELESKKLTEVKLMAKGHRGLVYKAGDKIIKKQKPDSEAKGAIEREGKVLADLNKYGIGPKLYSIGKDYIIIEYAKGTRIKEYIEKASKKNKIRVFKQVLKQCYALDKLNYNKEEMQNPYKHVIIGKKTVMIDFERCKKTMKVKNVTQFLQYIKRYIKIDAPKLGRGYSKDEDLNKILKAIK